MVRAHARPADECKDLVYGDVLPDRAALLGPGEQRADRRLRRSEKAALGDGLHVDAGAGEGLGQVALVSCLGGDPAEELEESRPRLAACPLAAGDGGESIDVPHDDRLVQRLLCREVPVDGADPDAGVTGDFVDRHRQPLLGEDRLG